MENAVGTGMKPAICAGCGRDPAVIGEYIVQALFENMTEQEFVVRYDRTYIPETGEFLCSSCYVKAGIPNGTAEEINQLVSNFLESEKGNGD